MYAWTAVRESVCVNVNEFFLATAEEGSGYVCMAARERVCEYVNVNSSLIAGTSQTRCMYVLMTV
jgi:hypothetical protein